MDSILLIKEERSSELRVLEKTVLVKLKSSVQYSFHLNGRSYTISFTNFKVTTIMYNVMNNTTWKYYSSLNLNSYNSYVKLEKFFKLFTDPDFSVYQRVLWSGSRSCHKNDESRTIYTKCLLRRLSSLLYTAAYSTSIQDESAFFNNVALEKTHSRTCPTLTFTPK